MSSPPELQGSLKKFAIDHPDPRAVGFLMMQFGNTTAHENFVNAIKDAFGAHGITIVRADEKEYHHDLFPNVKTYMHGCGLGVAVFERIANEVFNPNVSLEVGYMLAMGKPVCMLKDQTLPTLPTDLTGRLYKNFDTQHAETTIPKQVDRWLVDWGLSLRPPPRSIHPREKRQ